MPELPEVQAHAERLTESFAGAVLDKFVPITFTALKTAVPAPDSAYGLPLAEVGRRAPDWPARETARFGSEDFGLWIVADRPGAAPGPGAVPTLDCEPPSSPRAQ